MKITSFQINYIHTCCLYFFFIVLVQVVPETSTKLSMSTEPSISGSTTIGLKNANTDEYNDKLTNKVIIM